MVRQKHKRNQFEWMVSLHISDGIPEQGDVGFIVKVRCALMSDQGKEECPPVKPSPAIFHWTIVDGIVGLRKFRYDLKIAIT